jgi:hypothetical protein
MDWLPTAKRDVHRNPGSWTETTDPKCCIHTTETSGWPSYNGWSFSPHATIKAIPGVGIEIRQHLPFSGSAFALRNLDGGVQTNRDFVFQFEFIGSSAPGGYYYWARADDVVLLAVYDEIVVPMFEGRGVPIRSRPFQPYPLSYGPKGKTNKVRLSGSEFDNYSGWLGHQHVPENLHGDPGAFPWGRMIQLAEERDMALSDDDIKKIAVKVWDLDFIPNVVNVEANPTVAGKTIVREIWKAVLSGNSLSLARDNAARNEIAALKAALAEAQATIVALREEVRASNNTVAQAASTAVAESLASSTVSVDVSVHGNVIP